MTSSGIGGHNVDNAKDVIRTSTTLAATAEVLKGSPDLDVALEALLVRARQLLPDSPPRGGNQFAKPTSAGVVSFELPQIAHYKQGAGGGAV